MKALFDITHPAHAHFFKNAIDVLKKQGWEIVVTSRHKECATELLDELGVPHHPLSRLDKGGLWALGRELVARDIALLRLVQREKPDVMLAIGGTFVAHVGALTRTPSLVFYDTENAKLQNAITYPLASLVVVPRCYGSWLPRHSRRYDGYHELAYLHPTHFRADRDTAIQAGLNPNGDHFLIRVVSWQANHDIGERGWTESLLRSAITFLSARGQVTLSSEGPLPNDLEALRYRGRPGDLHHLLAHCRLLVGESATLCSEAAVLGVPSVYAAHTGRGYTDEQEKRYGLVRNLRELTQESIVDTIEVILQQDLETWRLRQQQLLAETIDVTQMVVELAAEFGTASSNKDTRSEIS